MEQPGVLNRFPARPLFIIVLLLLAVPGSAYAGRSESHRRELDTLEPSFRKSVLKGWRYFHTSFAEDGVACVHCHRDHEDIVPWSGSYPKVQVFDGTPYKVRTLREVIFEAMARHTDLEAEKYDDMAEDLQAYIAWWGDGQALAPGINPGELTPEEDLAELKRSIARGRSLFNREEPVSCSHCHTTGGMEVEDLLPLSDAVLEFPRPESEGGRHVSLDRFLLSHYRSRGLVMSDGDITDIMAYLAELSRGRILRPGTPRQRKGQDR